MLFHLVDIEISKQKVKVYPVENYAIHKGNHNNEVILGYGHLNIYEIEEGIKKVKKGINIFTTEY